MPDYSPQQRKIIDRYYDNRDGIMLAKLGELVGELYLADADAKRAKLWDRVAKALKNLKVPEATAAHILKERRPELLASHLKDWTMKK
ncbi:MAG TPA: hypothetical protein VJZ71_05355 [Phycisphaerae bacterium]|nr:hypothetical protein [Phycisphaerae bacterium]